MSEPVLPFSLEEYASRLAKTRDAMEAAGVELLIASDPSNMAWLTGYDGWSFYVHQCVLVPPAGEPIWYGRGMDAKGALRTVYLDHDNIVAYSDDYVMTTERHPMERLASVIEERGFARMRIGVEMDNYYYSAAAHAVLRRCLPDAEFVDATGLVNWQRTVKSQRELEYMRTAGRIVTRMHERIAEIAEPGRRKNDVAAEILRTGIAGLPDAGGDYPAIVPLLPSGRDASAAHLTWTDEPLRAGEATCFEIAGCYRRYHCPLCRTVYLGDPPDRVRRAEGALLEAMDDGLSRARAGNTCDDVAAAFFGTLEKHGVYKDTRAGYPIGLSYPPDWGERTMSIRRGDRSELRVDMTFHFMTGVWFDDWGLELTESIVIREGAPELLASVPRGLLVKEA